MHVYLVGGAVRDRLLSLPVHERDWVVIGSTPEEMIALGYRQVGIDFPVFLHPETAEEYALARTERKSGKGHKGFQVFSSPEVSLEQDLQRRDLTINAIAEDEQGELIDPYAGLDDIKRRVLRHISPAFSEDPLRVLRVARFAARFWQLGFTIDASTLKLMSSLSQGNELLLLSKERIWQETERALNTSHPEIYFLTLLHVGALACLTPLLNSALNNKQTLLQLAKLRDIEDAQFRYTGLIMLASEHNNHFDTQRADEINNYFACPGSLQDITKLCVRHFNHAYNALSSDSETILNILKNLDAFRRQSRAIKCIACMQALMHLFDRSQTTSFIFLTNLIPKLNDLKLSPQKLASLKGKAIGEAIDQQRIHLITELLNANALNKNE